MDLIDHSHESNGSIVSRKTNSLIQLWRYRGFIVGSIAREFELRYRNSLLGIVWTFLNPLAMILIYTLIFSQIMRARLPGSDTPFAYSIYLMSGLLPWGLFIEILNRGQNLFLENANLLKKLSFPKLCLPVIALSSSLINFAIVFSLFVFFLVLSGSFPGWVFLTFIPVLCLQICLAMGIALILGVLNVFFRDVGHFFNIFLQFWFWLTPIIYVIEFIPEPYRWWIGLNPMTPIVNAYHQIFVYQQAPQWLSLLPTAILSAALLLLALHLFQKRSDEMVDEL